MDKVLKFISSLRLTVALLSFSLVLVFVGTIAQVEQGLWDTQVRFFRSLFVYWKPAGGEFGIPVLPGGYLLGWALLVNLLAAHYVRFKFAWSKLGIFLTHFGLIFLLLGQFFTEQFQVESNLRIEEGETLNYSTASMRHELVVIDKSDAGHDTVVSFPENLLRAGTELSHAALPFTIRIKEYYDNSEPAFRPPAMTNVTAQGDHGIAERFSFTRQERETRMDRRNIPASVLELNGGSSQPLGTWLVSPWASDATLVRVLRDHWRSQFGAGIGQQVGDLLAAPQVVKVDDRSFEIALRSTRYYTPHAITLLDFRHDKYIGTETPKNYSAQIRLTNAATGEDREVLIKMNQPLRYGGITYFQSSFERDQRTGESLPNVTILQVVRNPAWLTPYISVIVIGLGLIVQFSMHLFKFVNRRKTS